ncbi:MAG: hypothetical protein RQ741_14435 [Wenzhouxiangellaceae bacterium]|nr:hypothetical protein [Wenzhouxiangellaceae bacterium]
MSEFLASPLFMLSSVVLIIAALAFLLLPLLRRNPVQRDLERRKRALEHLRDELEPADFRKRMADIEQRLLQGGSGSGPHRGLIGSMLVGLPAAAVALYLWVGAPDGIKPAPGQMTEVAELMGDLAQTLKSEPDNVETWNRWGMVQKQLQQLPAAEAAFRRVLFIDPENVLARVELAETLLFSSGRPSLPDAGQALLESVLRDDPGHQKALWLAGLGAYYGGQPGRAIALWTRLSADLPDGGLKQQVEDQIAQARGMGPSSLPPGHPVVATAASEQNNDAPVSSGASSAAPNPASTRESAASAGNGLAATESPAPAIEVRVELAPALRSNLVGNETLFIFARAVAGPAAPLAIKRLSVADLPATVVLRESDSMAPGLSLSRFPNIDIVARISASGNAIAAAGDLQGQRGPLQVAETSRVEIEIDSVIE